MTDITVRKFSSITFRVSFRPTHTNIKLSVIELEYQKKKSRVLIINIFFYEGFNNKVIGPKFTYMVLLFNNVTYE